MRRTSAILALVGLAPLAVFAAMSGSAQLREQERRDSTDALAVTRQINARADGLILADQSALAVLAGAAQISARDWPGARLRSLEVMRGHPNWREVLLTDLTARSQLWSTRSGVGAAPIRSEVTAFVESPATVAAIGDVAGSDAGCPCIPLHREIFVAGSARYVLTARVSAQPMQDALLRETRAAGMGPPNVSAMVDRRGNFLARSLDYPQRLGQPATRFVRGAIARAPSGIYHGVTYEGLENRTAYEASALSGFSTHIAIPERSFRLAGAGSYGLTLLAIAVALLVAALVVWFALREQSQWRAAEQRLVQSQKLAALGQFASGVAHDFNNVLHVILGSIAGLEPLAADPKAARRLSHLRQAAEKGAELTQELLRFARNKPIELECLPLADLLADLEGLLRRAVGESVAMNLVIDDPALAIRTNRSGIEMALLNLATNARDAMPGGGELTIAACRSDRADCVDLSVSDNGSGMPADVAARALDPFFTTKQSGQGTGLGLAQVQTLMLQSHGTIAISSATGKGTTITLTFPRDDAPGEAAEGPS